MKLLQVRERRYGKGRGRGGGKAEKGEISSGRRRHRAATGIVAFLQMRAFP